MFHNVCWNLFSWNSAFLETFVLKDFGGGVDFYQHIFKCFNFDEKSTTALANILMKKSACVLGTVLRQDGSLLKPA